MYEASFSEVIRVLLIFLLIYFGFKILIRLFGPLLLKFVLKKLGQKFGQQFHQYDASRKQEKEGKVSVEKKPKAGRKSKKDVGEYIDYEEID